MSLDEVSEAARRWCLLSDWILSSVANPPEALYARGVMAFPSWWFWFLIVGAPLFVWALRDAALLLQAHLV